MILYRCDNKGILFVWSMCIQFVHEESAKNKLSMSKLYKSSLTILFVHIGRSVVTYDMSCPSHALTWNAPWDNKLFPNHDLFSFMLMISPFYNVTLGQWFLLWPFLKHITNRFWFWCYSHKFSIMRCNPVLCSKTDLFFMPWFLPFSCLEH
jgi:hypothetical protein